MYLTSIPANLIDPTADKDAQVNVYGFFFDKYVEEIRKKNNGVIPPWL